jgi:hypothetical protein
MSKKKGANEYQTQKEARFGLVHRLSLLTLGEISECLVHNYPVINLAMGGLPTLETDY